MSDAANKDSGLEEYVWVPDRKWTVDPEIVAGQRCRYAVGPRHAVCRRPAAAALLRSNGWWCYCDDPDHLYGRRIRDDGVVEVRVHPESPAAEQGYVE